MIPTSHNPSKCKILKEVWKLSILLLQYKESFIQCLHFVCKNEALTDNQRVKTLRLPTPPQRETESGEKL